MPTDLEQRGASTVLYTYNPRTQGVETGELGIHAHSSLPRKFDQHKLHEALPQQWRQGPSEEKPVGRSLSQLATGAQIFQEWLILGVPVIFSNWLETLWGLNTVW